MVWKRTLYEMARCILRYKGSDLKLRTKAQNFRNYLLNTLTTKDLLGVTPKEKWSRRKPIVKHLPIFGNVAWAHILDAKWKKLDHKSSNYIFVGYVITQSSTCAKPSQDA
jgi:hypothetical protein